MIVRVLSPVPRRPSLLRPTKWIGLASRSGLSVVSDGQLTGTTAGMILLMLEDTYGDGYRLVLCLAFLCSALDLRSPCVGLRLGIWSCELLRMMLTSLHRLQVATWTSYPFGEPSEQGSGRMERPLSSRGSDTEPTCPPRLRNSSAVSIAQGRCAHKDVQNILNLRPVRTGLPYEGFLQSRYLGQRFAPHVPASRWESSWCLTNVTDMTSCLVQDKCHCERNEA